MGDKELHEALLRKDTSSQKLFFDRYWEPMIKLCHFEGLQTADAEDVVQEAFARFLEHPEKYDSSVAGMYSWLVRVIRNGVYDKRRKASAQKRGSGNVVPFEDGMDNSTDSEVLLEINSDYLLSAIEAIKTSRYKEVIDLHAIQGYKHAEIADMIGCSENTIKGDYHRAKIALKRVLAEQGFKIRA